MEITLSGFFVALHLTIYHVTTIRHLNELLANAEREERLNASINNGITTVEAALGALQRAGIMNSPDYWRNLVNSNEVPHLGQLLINLANRCLLPPA